MNFPRIVFTLISVMILLTACGSNVPATASSPQDESGTVATTVPATEVPATVAGPSSTDEAKATPAVLPPAEADLDQPEERSILPLFSEPVTASGELLILYGRVLDRNGQPLNGYAVEIWQVDMNGSYDHPNDPSTQNRDRNFQFYGTSLTDENGFFAFRTIVPARYEPRPRHIHFKVKGPDGREVLTSQFYFSDDVDAGQLGSDGEMLLLDLKDAQDAGGNPVKLAYKDLVVNSGSGGNMTLTPSQMEGPYYPVVDVSVFDNDLASVQ